MNVLTNNGPSARRRSGGWLLTAVAAIMLSGAGGFAGADIVRRQAQDAAQAAAPSITTARHLFYSGRYAEAAAMALALRASAPEDLATFELRTSALHFQIRRAMGEGEDKDKALKACASCADLMDVFFDETTKGRGVAHARLEQTPADPDALFFLGKLDLNYVWLQLGTLGRRTGWKEYWEARHSLDAVLKDHPTYVRARVARAWIDYIVDTKMTLGFRWVLGGGNKKKALAVIHEAAATATDLYDRTEAAFGLWEMDIREKNFTEAVTVASGLARQFPENRELARFIAEHGPPAIGSTPRR
jgi:hypothetical protein